MPEIVAAVLVALSLSDAIGKRRLGGYGLLELARDVALRLQERVKAWIWALTAQRHKDDGGGDDNADRQYDQSRLHAFFSVPLTPKASKTISRT